MIASSVAFLLSLILTFSLPRLSSPIQLTLLVTFFLIVSSTSQTAFNVSQYALASEMTGNSRQLSGLLSLAGVISQILTIASVAIAPLLIQWAGGGAAAYARMGLVFAAATLPLLLIFYQATRRIPVVGHSGAGATLSLWVSIKATAQNRPLLLSDSLPGFSGGRHGDPVQLPAVRQPICLGRGRQEPVSP